MERLHHRERQAHRDVRRRPGLRLPATPVEPRNRGRSRKPGQPRVQRPEHDVELRGIAGRSGHASFRGQNAPEHPVGLGDARRGHRSRRRRHRPVSRRVSRRTRFPSLRELYSGALGRFEPNPELRPENLQAGEVGITASVGDARLQLVGFHQRLSDGIVRARTVTTEGIRFKRVNRDDIRSTGVELLGAGTRGRLNFGGDLTLKRVRVLDSSLGGEAQRAEYEPAVSATLNLGVVAPEAVDVNGFLRYRGVQYCENVEVAGLDRLDSSTTVDLEARRIFQVGGGSSGRSVAGTVGVANVTDSIVLDQCGLPQPGRTLRIQFNVR
ncbi:MAG: TonB-dependent receptor [Gemmatimonadetes bacterium]|nr:TonB-dependent receptor [Gemmatimonadota bacterium]